MSEELKVYTDITLDVSGGERLFMVSAKQGDKKARYIRITLTNGGNKIEIPEDYLAIANIKKPDQHYCWNHCEIEDGKAVVELTSQALAVPGTGHCDLEIRNTDNTVVLSSQAFELEIEASMRNESAIESSNEFSEFEKRVNEVNAVSNEIKKAEESRKKAEQNRVTAENSRVVAEQEREKKTAEAVEKCEKSIPKKGVDYYTDEDKQEMVEAVLAALPDGTEVSY